jgi:hypothetical protein
MYEKVIVLRRHKTHKHHWTLNSEEHGEVLYLTAKEHGYTHGTTNQMEDDLAIRREIIFELAQVIPIQEIPSIIADCMDKIRAI